MRFQGIQNRIQVRWRYLGWFVSSALFVILTHAALFVALAGMYLGATPYIGMASFSLALISVGLFTHFSARTFAPYERPDKVLSKSRHTAVKVTFVLVFLIFSSLNISRYALNVPLSTLTELLRPFVAIVTLILYSMPALSGWHSGRMLNAVDLLDASTGGERLPDQSKVAEIFQIDSKSRYLILVSSIGIAGIVSAAVYDFRFGFTTVAGLFAIYTSLKNLYPD